MMDGLRNNNLTICESTSRNIHLLYVDFWTANVEINFLHEMIMHKAHYLIKLNVWFDR